MRIRSIALVVLAVFVLAPHAVRADTAPAAQPFFCDAANAVFRSGDAIVVDRRATRSAGTMATYRLDDHGGYWTFPATSANLVAFALPAGLAATFNLSIAKITASDGTPHACTPAVYKVSLDGLKPFPGEAPAAIAPASHDDAPAPCADPFISAHVVSAAAPPLPPAATGGQGLDGIVQVLVVVGADGKLSSTSILSSPAPVLNRGSITAAQSSTYDPEVFRCVAYPGRYVYTVKYGQAATRL